MEEETSCPCCGGPRILGLFDLRPAVESPLPVAWISSENPGQEAERHEETISVLGRYFVPAQLSFPIGDADSPLTVRIWIEISEDDAAKIQSVREGEKRSHSGPASLACDIPGFRGSFGSPCRFHFRAGQGEPQLTGLADQRIPGLGSEMDHEEKAALYRRLWGNPFPVAEVDQEIRNGARARFMQFIGRDVFIQKASPPPQIAGIEPTEVLVAPPVDTGQPAWLATVGCGDVSGGDQVRYEVFCQIRDPSPDFISCFAEFGYITRLNSRGVVSGGIVVPEARSVPDSDGKMVGWLLCEPWWESAPTGLEIGGKSLRYLAAMPLHGIEVAYASINGESALVDIAAGSGADFSRLDRPPLVEGIF